jgi:hypothetical protein
MSTVRTDALQRHGGYRYGAPERVINARAAEHTSMPCVSTPGAADTRKRLPE